MPRQSIDQKTIVEKAYELAESQGLAALNMRGVARECGVSVDALYRYFPTKADLTTAVITHFFQQAFYDDFCSPQPHERFLPFCRRLFASMTETLSRFRSDWVDQTYPLSDAEMSVGKQREARQFEHMREGLQAVLERDETIDCNHLPGNMTSRRLCDFILDCMVDAIRARRNNCDALFDVLESALGAEGSES